MKFKLEQVPQNFQRKLAPAIEMRELGKYEQAQAWLNTFIQDNPDNPEALSLLSQVLLLDKKEIEAGRALTKAASINSKLPSVCRNKARLLIKQSQPKEALKMAQLACEYSPKDLESLLVLAACLGSNQRDLESAQLLEKILQARPNYSEAYSVRALINLRAKDAASAINDIEMAVSLKPHLTQMWGLLSSLYHQLNRLGDAIDALRNALKNEPKDVAMMTQLGELCRQNDKVDEAIEILKETTVLTPKDTTAWTNLGVAFQQAKRIADAKMAYQKALALNPKSAAVLNNLGALAKNSDELTSAYEYFKRALDVDPSSFEAHSNLGNILGEMRRFEEAEKSFKKAIKLKPDFGLAYNNLANILKEQERLDEAEANYKQAITVNPGYADAYNNLGNLYGELGIFEEAEANFKQAISLNPNSANAYQNLGNTLGEQGQFEKAEANFKQAIALEPDFASAYCNLGILLQRLGRSKEAEEYFEQATILQPDFAEAHRHLSSIKRFDALDRRYTNIREIYLDKSISEEQRCNINFALAKAHEDLEEFDQAYFHYNEGNSLRKKLLGYNPSEDAELFDMIKAHHREIEENSIKLDGLSSDITPIFIVGMPRSGTTLIEQIVSSHWQVTGAGELPLVNLFGQDIATGFFKASSDALVHFRDDYLTRLKNLSNGNSIVTDKMPHNFRYVGLLCAAFPEAKIVHVKRDPAAVCWGNYKQYFTSKNLRYSNDLSDIVNYYKLYSELMHFWENSVGHRIYKLNYDTLTVNQEREIRQLIDHLGLDWDKKCLSPQENNRSVATASSAQVRRKIYQGSSENWKNYEPFLNGLLDQFS
ncbi:tetratricopeptide repeat protein [Alphaproteobacteria bacterium]|nr:tetratricopeptide repeat protein [Alphaproteobacteria bacterium]